MYEFITPLGKRSAVAKGVRKAQARLASHLELFCEIDLMMVQGRGKAGIVTSARILRQVDLSNDYARLRRGFLLLEITGKLTDTEDTAETYDLLAAGLDAMAENDPPLVELWFKLRLLHTLGHFPRLDKDSENAALNNSTNYFFDISQGTLSPVSSGGNISNEAIKLWRLALKYSPAELEKLGKACETASKSLDMIDRFITEQFGLRFKAAEM